VDPAALARPGRRLSDTDPAVPPGHRAVNVDAVFAALADPTRRSVLQRLSEQGPLTATELARVTPVSRQAVVKHLSQLADAGLVGRRRTGREVRYGLEAGTLDPAQAWLVEVGGQWDRRLRALDERLAARQSKGGEAGP